MELESLRDLFVKELKDIYDAEHRILEALPKMAEAASTDDLRKAFEEHRRQTEGQVRRLEEVFSIVQVEAERDTCEGMKGLISEGEEIVKKDADDETKDAGLIASAQKVEHYEIASYGTLRTYAETLGEDRAASLLQETLDEESATDEKLTKLATRTVNPEAARTG